MWLFFVTCVLLDQLVFLFFYPVLMCQSFIPRTITGKYISVVIPINVTRKAITPHPTHSCSQWSCPRDRINSGSTLSDAVTRYPDNLSNYNIAVTRWSTHIPISIDSNNQPVVIGVFFFLVAYFNLQLLPHRLLFLLYM